MTVQRNYHIYLIRWEKRTSPIELKLPFGGSDLVLWHLTGKVEFLNITQCQAQLVFDRYYFGSPIISTITLTKDHRDLAKSYLDSFRHSFSTLSRPSLLQLHHLFTRLIYEYLFHDNQLPFPPVLSPHQQYAHPKANVCIYQRPSSDFRGYVDIQVGSLTYVLGYGFGLRPWLYMIELHSLIVLYLKQYLELFKLVGWLLLSPQGDCVSQHIDSWRQNDIFIPDNYSLACKHTYLHVNFSGF